VKPQSFVGFVWHPDAGAKDVLSRYGRRRRGRRSIWWGDGTVAAFVLSRTPVHPFGLGWMRPPSFVIKPLESPVRIERRTPGSERGARRRPRETEDRAGRPLYR